MSLSCKKSTTWKWIVWVGIFGLLLLPSWQSAQADTIVLRMAHVLKEGDPAYTGSAKLAELVEKYTEGRVVIKVFPAGQLGDNTKLYTQIRSGAIDMSLTPFPVLADIVPEFNVITAGYMYDSWGQMTDLLNHPDYGQKWKSQLIEKGGLRILSDFYYGARVLTTTSKIVRSPADAKGLKIRAVPNAMSLATVSGLGANPTPVAWTETFQALRQGVVDGQENPIPVFHAAKFFEVQKYVILTEHQRTALPFVIREAQWQRISPADQEAFVKAAKDAAQVATDETNENTVKLVNDLKKEGMTIIELTEEERDAFKESVRKAVKETFDGKILPAGLIQEIIDLNKK